MTHSEMSPFCVFWMNQSVGGWTGWSAEYFSIFFFFLWGRGMLCSMGNLSSHQGLNPHPLQWKHRVLPSGLLGKSLPLFLNCWKKWEELLCDMKMKFSVHQQSFTGTQPGSMQCTWLLLHSHGRVKQLCQTVDDSHIARGLQNLKYLLGP